LEPGTEINFGGKLRCRAGLGKAPRNGGEKKERKGQGARGGVGTWTQRRSKDEKVNWTPTIGVWKGKTEGESGYRTNRRLVIHLGSASQRSQFGGVKMEERSEETKTSS